jgi:hypothetical protein
MRSWRLCPSGGDIVGAPGLVYALDSLGTKIVNLTQKADSQGLKNIKAMVADITGVFPIAEQCVDVCFYRDVLHTLNLKKTEIQSSTRSIEC